MTPTNPTPEPWSDVSPLEKRVAALEEALREIRDHWACQYDHPRKESKMYRGPYGTGITDGHRAAAIIARRALGAEGEERG